MREPSGSRTSPIQKTWGVFIKNLLFVIIIAAFFILPLYSQEGSRLITSIEITGLTRTKPHIAQYPLEKFLGRDSSTLDLNEVEAAVRDMGTLEPKSIDFVETEDGVILHVTVAEKWTILPIPIFSASSGHISAGLFFMDSNAFGIRDMMAIGGIYDTSGWMVVAMYNHTPSRKGMPGWNGFFMFNRSEVKNTDKYETVHRRFSADQLRFSLGIRYPFTDILSAGVSVSFSNISLNEISDPIDAPENGAMLLNFSPSLTIQSSSWDGFLLSQRSLSVDYDYHHGISGSSYHQAGFRATYEQSLVPGFRITLRTGAVWKSSADPLYENGPSSAQVDILPRDFAARNYAGLSAGLEKYIFSFSWGTLSILGAWQVVFSQGLISGNEFDNGPSAGIRLYLSRIAIPAVGLGAAYNINSGLFQLAVSIGMSL